ncbi:hypothetical protein B0H34DRAFT_716225 [Crassisporium funariophilum]|nr:hypothetical protein B0H34DRAFT_716225 [Crassisporium funariophilum]
MFGKGIIHLLISMGQPHLVAADSHTSDLTKSSTAAARAAPCTAARTFSTLITSECKTVGKTTIGRITLSILMVIDATVLESMAEWCLQFLGVLSSCSLCLNDAVDDGLVKSY